MSRVFAVLVAIALIVGAVLARGMLDDDGGDGGGGGRDDGPVRVVCSTELEVACDGLGSSYTISVEDTASTATALRTANADDAGVDVWVAPWPWPEIVDGDRERAGLPRLFGEPVTLARSELAAIVPESIGPCDWACLGERATGDLRVGGRALDSGVGVIHLAAFTAGRLGTTTYASNDLDAATQSFLRGLDDAVDGVSNPVTRLLQIRASYDVALTHRAEAETLLAGASEDRRIGLEVTYPEPVLSLVAVAAPVGDGSVPDGLGAGLQARGWSAPSDAPNGLPSAGVLTALLEVLG